MTNFDRFIHIVKAGEKPQEVSREYHPLRPIQRWLTDTHFHRAKSISEDMAVSEFLPRLEAKVAEGMQYRKGLDAIYEEDLEGSCATFILQKGSMGRRGGVKLGDTQAVIEELPANEISAAENILDIELNAHDDGAYALVLSYDIERYSRQSMFSAFFAECNYGELHRICRYCLGYSLLMGLLGMVGVLAYPQLLDLLFGMEGIEEAGKAYYAARIFCLGTIFMGVCLLLQNYLQSEEDEKGAFLVSSCAAWAPDCRWCSCWPGMASLPSGLCIPCQKS